MMRWDVLNNNDMRKMRWWGDDGELNEMRGKNRLVLMFCFFVDWKLEEDLCSPCSYYYSSCGALWVFLVKKIADFSLLPYSSLHFIGSLSSLICWFHAADDDDEDDDMRQITHTHNLNQRDEYRQLRCALNLCIHTLYYICI